MIFLNYMASYSEWLLNLKKLKDDSSVNNDIFICPSFIGVPESHYANDGDVYMTNKNALYGVGQFVKSDVKNKEESLITLNDLDNLPEESNKVDIEMNLGGSPNTNYVDNNDNTYTAKCINTTCIIKHNDILVKSCYITCVSISTVYGEGTNADSWGNGYNYENHEVGKGSITGGNNSGYIYVNTSITKNTNDKYTLSTSIKQTLWSNNGSLSNAKTLYITVYFTVVKGDGDETELNTQQTKLLHETAADATAEDVKYDGKLKFSYKFNTKKNIFTGTNIEISYPKS